MKLFNFLKHSNKPLYIRDFDLFIRRADEKALKKFAETLPEGQTIDFTNNTFGHSFVQERQLTNLVMYGYGFYSGGLIIGGSRIKAGDFFKCNTTNNQIGTYLVLKIEYENNPTDMFWAYLACVSIEDKTKRR